MKPSNVRSHKVKQKVPCAERVRLLIEYSEAVSRLEPLAQVLSDGTLSYRRETFLDAWERLKDAAEKSVRLRAALLNHVNQHGCSVQIASRNQSAA